MPITQNVRVSLISFQWKELNITSDCKKKKKTTTKKYTAVFRSHKTSKQNLSSSKNSNL